MIRLANQTNMTQSDKQLEGPLYSVITGEETPDFPERLNSSMTLPCKSGDASVKVVSDICPSQG